MKQCLRALTCAITITFLMALASTGVTAQDNTASSSQAGAPARNEKLVAPDLTKQLNVDATTTSNSRDGYEFQTLTNKLPGSFGYGFAAAGEISELRGCWFSTTSRGKRDEILYRAINELRFPLQVAMTEDGRFKIVEMEEGLEVRNSITDTQYFKGDLLPMAYKGASVAVNIKFPRPIFLQITITRFEDPGPTREADDLSLTSANIALAKIARPFPPMRLLFFR